MIESTPVYGSQLHLDLIIADEGLEDFTEDQVTLIRGWVLGFLEKESAAEFVARYQATFPGKSIVMGGSFEHPYAEE